MSLPSIAIGTRRWRLLALVGNGLFQGAATFAASWALHSLIRNLGSGMNLLPMFVLVCAALTLFGLRWREGFDAESLGQNYIGRVRERLFSRIMALPLESRRRYRLGTTMVRLTGDLTALKNWVSLGIARLVVSVISLVATLVAISWFSVPAAVIATVTLGLCILAGLVVTPALRQSVRAARSQRGRLANRLGDRLFAAVTLRHLGRATKERKLLRREGKVLGSLLARRAAGFSALRALAELVFPLTLAGFIGFLAWHGNDLHPADMAALAVLLGQAAVSMRHAAIAWEYRLSFDQARTRIRTILSLKVLRDKGAVELPATGPESITCSEISLWNKGPLISIDIQKHDRVLLSGASGSGKSTLLAILARLADPAEGRVKLDGRPVNDYTLDSVSRTIRLVSPALPLVSGTIADNIRLGRPADKPVSIREIAELCELDKVGPGLERGRRSRVEDGGRNLPDGLRARVMLARALASRPSLLLIDDPNFLIDADATRALCAALALWPMTVIAAGDIRFDPISATRHWQLGIDGLTESVLAGADEGFGASNVHPLPLTRADDGRE